MDVESIIATLAGRGIRLIRDGDGIIAEPASKLTDNDRQALRQHKPELLVALKAASAELECIARLDRERNERDAQAKRGYDFDPAAPSFTGAGFPEALRRDTQALASERPERPAETWDGKFPPCPTDGHTRFWLTTSGAVVCGRCGTTPYQIIELRWQWRQ